MLLISGLSAHAERVADADDGPGSDEQLDTDDDSDGGDSEDGDSEDGDSEDGDSEDGDSGGGDATVTPPNDPIDPASAVLAVVGFGILAGLAGWWMVRRRSPDDQPFPQSDDEQWPPETML
jgi:cobalamin biosynthesis protein CobT